MKPIEIQNYRTAVVLPCYKVEKQIPSVIAAIPDFIDFIIVVDDKSPDDTGKIVTGIDNNKIHLLTHKENKGVGGAMKTGFEAGLKLGADIMVKIDGDGQMDPSIITRFIQPVAEGNAHYTKGNRFLHLKDLTQMPFIRRFGNVGLAFLVRAASGYWDIFDPSNGYIAIAAETWHELDKEKIADDYYFETSMLIELNKIRARITDIPMPAKYGNETSNLSISKTLFTFPVKLLKAFLFRIYIEYFVMDFNFGSLSLLGGIPLLLFGGIWSMVQWHISNISNTPATTGTVIIGLLPIILGFQLILQFITFDINKKW